MILRLTKDKQQVAHNIKFVKFNGDYVSGDFCITHNFSP
ncbi:hypothetical protein BSPLISOX_431 [uncultured Gammaproteobacteria bacterium]|nr:hypothetical protein BSPLISOX_431 [uncultured Gammaproteobacteria bacterium]